MHIGIDLGGTKTELIVLDAKGRQLWRHRQPTPAGDYAACIRQIRRMVQQAEVRHGAASVGIGTPGSLRYDRRMKNCNSTWLNDMPLLDDLQDALQRPVAMANDANCFALSESVDGSGAGAEVVFAVILGTGVGAGICVAGRVLQGMHGIAGEWGHNPLPWAKGPEVPGPACYCGRSGCIETWLSGPGMRSDHWRQTETMREPADIVAAARQGERSAARTLEAYIDRLARALAHVVNILDPEVIVLGGGMSNIESLYREVPRRWGRYVFSDLVRTRLLPPKHGDSSGVRGAAWLGARRCA